MTEQKSIRRNDNVAWMREASPYIRAHRGEICVVYIGGEALNDVSLEGLIQDLILLRGLGLKLIIVHGARPQIDACCRDAGLVQPLLGNLRVTDAATLACVKNGVSAVRLELEARLSQAAMDMPNRGASLTVSGGNFVIARPAGIINGVDLHFTGEVRRIDRQAITRRLDDDELVLVSPLGYSPTGEIFNLNALDLATAVACEFQAAKLILMADSPGIVDGQGGAVRQLTIGEARELDTGVASSMRLLACATRACQFGVSRVHIVDRTVDGVLLQELFTRDGVGTLVSHTPMDHLRRATIEDVGGILALIEPLEQDGLLVKRSREKLEMEIDHYSVIIREGTVIACGALHPFPDATGEFACIAVHPGYRSGGFGNDILRELERRAEGAGLRVIFVLTTQATHWFQERGYVRASTDDLPLERRALYNEQRNSVVMMKSI